MFYGEDQKQQLNPLLPGYSFNLYLVAGTTPIIENGPLDFFIDRPNGMKGYIINMTVKGEGKVFDGEDSFIARPGELLLFPPEAAHYYGRAPGSRDWYHRWVYFRPRGYWANWLKWPRQTRKVGRLTLPTQALIDEFDELFQQIDRTHHGGRATSEELAINLLERLLIRAYEETPENLPTPLDSRIQAACQFIAKNLAEELSLDEIARHVCLSPSRLAHLFREEMGVNILRWREDQRIILAKHLLQSTRTPVSCISEIVGYDDQLYFSRVFRKRVGISPSGFRKSCDAIPHAPLAPQLAAFAGDSGPAGLLLKGRLT
jgi:AraC family transcriptional regulator of arabinose operon